MAITFSNIGLAEPSTITNRAAAVTIARGSTNEQQEILCIGDGQSSLGVAVVTDTTPASTAFGVVVREAAPSTGPIAVSSIAGPVTIRSSAANALVSVYQSTAADLNVTVAGYSTTVNVSSVGGAVIVRSSAADALVSVYQSTAADLNVTVAGYSTTVNVSSLAGAVTVRNSTAGELIVTPARASTTVRASVTQSSTSVTLQAASTARLGWSVYNRPTQGASLYVKFGATASTSDFDVLVPANSFYELSPVMTGRIDGIWDSTGTGFARVTEYVP